MLPFSACYLIRFLEIKKNNFIKSLTQGAHFFLNNIRAYKGIQNISKTTNKILFWNLKDDIGHSSPCGSSCTRLNFKLMIYNLIFDQVFKPHEHTCSCKLFKSSFCKINYFNCIQCNISHSPTNNINLARKQGHIKN